MADEETNIKANSPSPLLKGKGLPEFPLITSEEVKKEIPKLLEQLNKELTVLEQSLSLIQRNLSLPNLELSKIKESTP